MSNLNTKPCPCGSGLSYKACCRPLHLKKTKAKTAEALMRSRFCAYYLAKQKPELSRYILTTWCLETRPGEMDLSHQPSWTKLKIHRTEQGQMQDKNGLVEFSAYYIEDQDDVEFREVSEFLRTEKGDWCYLKGEIKNL